MKKLEDMSSVEKAAALIVAIGPDAAGEIYKHLDKETIIKLTSEVAKIRSMSPEDKEDLIGEFILEIRKNRTASYGGEEFAKNTLLEAFGADKAEAILSKVESMDLEEKLKFLHDADPKILNGILENEHPQTTALILSQIKPAKAAEIIKLFTKERAKETAVRLAKMNKVSPEAIYGIIKIIKKKYDDIIEKNIELEAGGVSRLAMIMNHIDMTAEAKIISHLETVLPKEAQELRDKIYSFDNIALLTNKEIRLLIDELNNDSLIATALKGAGDDIRFKILRNMSNNRATDVINDMNRMGAIRMSEINSARREIVEVMKSLNDNGSIIIRKKDEEYIE